MSLQLINNYNSLKCTHLFINSSFIYFYIYFWELLNTCLCEAYIIVSLGNTNIYILFKTISDLLYFP